MRSEYRFSGEPKTWVVSQTTLAKILGLTQPRISQLLDEGLLIRDAESNRPLLIDSLRNYYLSRNVSGDEIDYNAEKARLMKAKRELAELKLARAKGEVYDAKDVEETFRTLVTILRRNLLNMPAKFARQLEMKSGNEIHAALDAEIRACLTEIADFDLSDLSARVDLDDEED